MKIVAVQTRFFAFENDFVDTFRCVPMIVRYKLDTCGVKLKLPEWVKFSKKHKEILAHLHCYTDAEIEQYRIFVKSLVYTYTGKDAGMLSSIDDSWNNLFEIPAEVQQKASEWNCPALILKDWMTLNTLQRFALVKLSRSGHEGKNFPAALSEFGIF